MAEHNELYQRAVYYDIVFGRDVSREVGFIQELYGHHTGRALGSVLELASGPGYHARAFARAGVRAVGLDLQPAMLDLARERAAAEGLSVSWIKGDMRDFRLDEPVDAAITMFDGLDALLGDDDLIRHFQAVATNLRRDGIYVIDLTHPRDSTFGRYGQFRYSGERDGLAVSVTWATNNPEYDPVTGIARVELAMEIEEQGKRTLIRDSAEERLLSPGEIRLLAQLSAAMQVVGWHGDYDVRQPLDSTAASRRMIAVLQKT